MPRPIRDQLTFASSSSGGTSHMAGEVFNMLAGVRIRHIPYKGGGPATIDLIGGHVQMFFSVAINIVGHVQSGKLKALAATGETRLTALPQTPTFADGGLRGLDVKTWHGVLAPAGTSRTDRRQAVRRNRRVARNARRSRRSWRAWGSPP